MNVKQTLRNSQLLNVILGPLPRTSITCTKNNFTRKWSDNICSFFIFTTLQKWSQYTWSNMSNDYLRLKVFFKVLLWFCFKASSQDVCRLRMTCVLKLIFGLYFIFSFRTPLKNGIVYTSVFLCVLFQQF